MRFSLRTSVLVGDEMRVRGTVAEVRRDEAGCDWVRIEAALTVDDAERVLCTITAAVPSTPTDNPWQRVGPQWLPPRRPSP